MKNSEDEKEISLINDACLHSRLISDLERVNRKISIISELSSEDFLPLNKRLRKYQSFLYDFAGNNQFREKLTTSGMYCSIERIIKDMQFSDVIQQRISHIVKINEEIINELNKIDYDNLYTDRINYIKLIPLFSGINMIQLHVLKSEYNTVVENLKKALFGIDQYMKTDLYQEPELYFNNFSLCEGLSNAVCSTLNDISKMVYSKECSYDDSSKILIDNISNLYTMKAERDVLQKVLEITDKGVDIYSMKDIIASEIMQFINDSRLELF